VKLLVNGKQYDVEAGMAQADLYSLYELKARYGIGMKSLLEAGTSMEGLDPMDLLEDEKLFQAFLAMIWLARRHAGEKLTLEEANAIPLHELQFLPEEGEELADPHQAPADSARGDAPREDA
jgi:hypothetical protein